MYHVCAALAKAIFKFITSFPILCKDVVANVVLDEENNLWKMSGHIWPTILIDAYNDVLSNV